MKYPTLVPYSEDYVAELTVPYDESDDDSIVVTQADANGVEDVIRVNRSQIPELIRHLKAVLNDPDRYFEKEPS